MWRDNDDMSYGDKVVDKGVMSVIVVCVGERNNYVR